LAPCSFFGPFSHQQVGDRHHYRARWPLNDLFTVGATLDALASTWFNIKRNFIRPVVTIHKLLNPVEESGQENSINVVGRAQLSMSTSPLKIM
jgi:hypothetical protein